MICLSSMFVKGTVLISFRRSLSVYSITKNNLLILVQSILSLLLIALHEILFLLISYSDFSSKPSNVTYFLIFFDGLVEACDYGVPIELEFELILIGDSSNLTSTELSFYKSSISLITSVLYKTSSGSIMSSNLGEKMHSDSFLRMMISLKTYRHL